jgi:hypothetical protein
MQIQLWEGAVLRSGETVPQCKAHGTRWGKLLAGKNNVVGKGKERR